MGRGSVPARDLARSRGGHARSTGSEVGASGFRWAMTGGAPTGALARSGEFGETVVVCTHVIGTSTLREQGSQCALGASRDWISVSRDRARIDAPSGSLKRGPFDRVVSLRLIHEVERLHTTIARQS